MLSGVALAAIFTLGCGVKTVQTAPILAVPVTVAKAVQKTVPLDLTSIGTGEAYATVSIKSQVNAELEQVQRGRASGPRIWFGDAENRLKS